MHTDRRFGIDIDREIYSNASGACHNVFQLWGVPVAAYKQFGLVPGRWGYLTQFFCKWLAQAPFRAGPAGTTMVIGSMSRLGGSDWSMGKVGRVWDSAGRTDKPWDWLGASGCWSVASSLVLACPFSV